MRRACQSSTELVLAVPLTVQPLESLAPSTLDSPPCAQSNIELDIIPDLRGILSTWGRRHDVLGVEKDALEHIMALIRGRREYCHR